MSKKDKEPKGIELMDESRSEETSEAGSSTEEFLVDDSHTQKMEGPPCIKREYRDAKLAKKRRRTHGGTDSESVDELDRAEKSLKKFLKRHILHVEHVADMQRYLAKQQAELEREKLEIRDLETEVKVLGRSKYGRAGDVQYVFQTGPLPPTRTVRTATKVYANDAVITISDDDETEVVTE